MSPGVTLQLFPPPPKMPPRQTSPIRRPRVKPPTPEPTAERGRADSANSAKSAKAPVDFHELIIQVNSVPVSPSVTVPESAHIPKPQITRTPPQESRPTFEPPPRPQAPSPTHSRAASPPVDADRNRSPSPAFSVQPTVQPAYNGTLAPINTSPDLTRSASPAFSDVISARSGSPTLVRANSAATYRSPISPGDAPPMRSIFPVYNPTIPLAQQQYHPTQTSPTHIPREKISRSPYSPDFYVPHSNVQPGQGSSSNSYKPYYTPAPLLDNLWLAANGQEEPAVQIYTLKMHRATASSNVISFGPTPSLPFYSLTQSNDPQADSVVPEQLEHEVLIKRHHPTQPRALPVTHLSLIAPPPTNTSFQPYGQFNEVSSSLLTSIYPKLAALAALDAAAHSPAASQLAWVDPGAVSPAAERLAQDVLRGAAERECCALAWTREPPSHQSNNPYAQAMTQGTYQLHHPTLGVFPVQLEGDCTDINTPSIRPTTAVYGHNLPQMQQPTRTKSGSITLLNPYILSPSSPRAFVPPPPLPRSTSRVTSHGSRAGSPTPSEMDITNLATTTDAAADDAVLAKLDFTTDSLILNVAALTRFGNPYLVDVAATTLLAVAVSESVRTPRTAQSGANALFEPPPPSSVLSGQKPKSSAASLKESFIEGLEAFSGGKVKAKAGRKWSLRSSATSRSAAPEKDIEMTSWYGQPEGGERKASKKRKQEDDDNLPFVTRAIIGVLGLAFKTVVWVLRIGIKIVAGLVVMISRNIGKL